MRVGNLLNFLFTYRDYAGFVSDLHIIENKLYYAHKKANRYSQIGKFTELTFIRATKIGTGDIRG